MNPRKTCNKCGRYFRVPKYWTKEVDDWCWTCNQIQQHLDSLILAVKDLYKRDVLVHWDLYNNPKNSGDPKK